MSKDTGGAAFPHDEQLDSSTSTIHVPSQGMTLRDYFSAKIAAAQCVATSADASYMKPDYVYPEGEQTVAQKIAENAYAVADAMLAARGAADPVRAKMIEALKAVVEFYGYAECGPIAQARAALAAAGAA